MRSSSYRSNETFLTQEITKGVQHAKEIKVAVDRNEEQTKTSNLTKEPEFISSQQISPLPAHPSPTPASTSSKRDKDDIHRNNPEGMSIYKL